MIDSRAQSEVQAVADELVASGAETGLQVAAIHEGRTVVDVVSGMSDAPTGAAVAVDTLFYAASTAKGVASTLAHVLVERGVLSYGSRVADVWPEFGAHGKGGVTLRHVLLHTAGVPGLPATTTVDDLLDWERMCAVIADEEPWWKPGTRFGYHAKTFGYVLGEMIRRTTGRRASSVLREIVTGPLGIEEEVHFGVPPALLPRVARQVGADGAEPPLPEPESPLARAMPAAVQPSAAIANRHDVLTADTLSEGTMTARGVARMYAALLGHVEGARLVSPDRLAGMAATAFTGPDEVMGFPITWAFGYSPFRPGGVPTRPGSTFGMVGANGSAAFADIDSGLAVAVMRNRFRAGDLTAVTRIDRIITGTLS
ncbi:MAG: beta-lactamase family protein [bacterium]|jgi:CubicO group peptidase (beta-lactamase class C family)|nr:beta-lactamase family protein [bacterium]